MDPADLSSLSKFKDKYKYLVSVIDIFSQHSWGVSLKDNTASSITAAFEIFIPK
jgi:hypothetical protein